MEKKYVEYIIISLVVTALAVGIYLISNNEDKPFVQVELNEDNSVSNNTKFYFYDTIMNVGLSELGLKNISVTIQPLTEKSKQDADAQGITLEAHLREYSGIYYLFMNESSKDQSIEIISHELIHLEQYESKRLVFENDTLTWNNQKFSRAEIPYDDRPWEIEAFSKGKDLAQKVRNILYNKD